jgi:predicted exporter
MAETARPRHRALGTLWSLCVVLILAGLGLQWSRGLHLESSVLALLPPDEQDPALHELTQQLSGRAARGLLVVVGHTGREEALAAAAFVERELLASNTFTRVQGALDPAVERAYFELYFPLREQMLSPRVRTELEAGAGPQELVARVRSLLSGPTSSLYSRLLEQDPLLFYADLAQSWAAAGAGFDASDGYVLSRHAGDTWALLSCETAADPFDAAGQRAALDAVEQASRSVAERIPGARLVLTGVPRFAAHVRQSMEKDIGFIGTGSLVGTALFILLAFRSLAPFLLSFLPIAVGTAAALSATFLAFERVHFLTLVFGTSLTGLGVDYALHYFAAHRLAGRDWDARRSMAEILPGISLGVLTSVLGFSGLYFTPFPVLRQFALFSSVGLIGAWATVVCWYPLLLKRPHRLTEPPWLHVQCGRFLDLWRRLSRLWVARAALLVLVLISVAAPLRLTFQDDVRKFQSTPALLLVEDQFVREVAGRADDSRFVLVEGASEQETLERLEAASAVVTGSVADGLLSGSRDVSRFLPSLARQHQDRALLAKALLSEEALLRSELDELGFETAVVDRLVQSLSQPPAAEIDPAAWLASPASEPLRPLWLGSTSRGHGAMILLSGLADAAGLEARLAHLPGVRWVDTVRDLSRLVERYRIHSTRLVILAYVGVLIALVLRFGPANGLRVMLPCVLSAGLTLFLLSLDGSSLTLFHLLGLLLVLGLAVDYGVIFAEHGTSEATALFAVLLSVLTTVMAFGLMSTSLAPPLWALGESVSLGIVLAFLFSPLSSLSASRSAGPRGSP